MILLWTTNNNPALTRLAVNIFTMAANVTCIVCLENGNVRIFENSGDMFHHLLSVHHVRMNRFRWWYEGAASAVADDIPTSSSYTIQNPPQVSVRCASRRIFLHTTLKCFCVPTGPPRLEQAEVNGLKVEQDLRYGPFPRSVQREWVDP